MTPVHVAIIGGGITGATAAAMLGRRGIDTVVFDPTSTDAPDFRCEKVDQGQLDRLEKCGLSDVFLAASTVNHSLWVGRGGRVVERMPYTQATAPYQCMVATMRRAIGGSARLVSARVKGITTTRDRQTIELVDGTTWSARLVVLATGPSPKLPRILGYSRDVLSPQHSVSIGFDMVSEQPSGFPFQSVTWFPERFDGATAYITVFEMGAVSRANLFVYRKMADPWLSRMRSAPLATLKALMPSFVEMAGRHRIQGPVRVRPVDLYRTKLQKRPGIALIGDAFATSDPAAGTGFDKAWNDVYYLVDRHIPDWLSTPGMAQDKIARFYEDPGKKECDAWSLQRALDSRSMASSSAPWWRARRRAARVVQAGRGAARKLIHRS